MKKFIYLYYLFSKACLLILIIIKAIVKIEMDVIRNGKIVGYSNYFFEHGDKKMTIKKLY